MMRKCHLLILFLISLLTHEVEAQDTRSLITEGLNLSKANNHLGAIEKFKAALAVDPANITAKYQMAFSLNATGKGAEAAPYLQEVVRSSASSAVMMSSYSLLASIYDRSGQPKKAIESYQKALQIDSANYSLLYGLGLAYFRDKQYKQAEESAVKAIAADNTKAECMRLYALVTFHQDKRAPAILGLCSFLYMEPNGLHSAEANENIKSILQGGVLKDGAKTSRTSAADVDTTPLNWLITKAVNTVNAKNSATKTNAFNEQLKAIFESIGENARPVAGNNFFRNQLVVFYKQLAQSAHMQTFGHYIRQGVNKTSALWLSAHRQQVAALQQWALDAKSLKVER